MSAIFSLQDGKTFLSLPQHDTQDNFFTSKTNSSSGGDSVHSELVTPPSDPHFSPNKSASGTSSGSGTKLSSGSGGGASSYLPNWSEFFPPPPACPPSEAGEASANIPLGNRNLVKQV